MEIWWNMGLAPTHKRAKSVILLPWMWKMMLNCEFWRPRRWYTDDHDRICLFNIPNNIEKIGKITANHIITGQICSPDSCMVGPLFSVLFILQEVDHQFFARDQRVTGPFPEPGAVCLRSHPQYEKQPLNLRVWPSFEWECQDPEIDIVYRYTCTCFVWISLG